MSDRIFYRLTPGGATATAIDKFREDYVAIRQSWFDFAKKHGAEEVFANNRLMGIRLKGEPPAGWVAVRGAGRCFKPQRRAESMDAYNELKKLKSLPTGMELARRLNIDVVLVGLSMPVPTFEKVGEEMLLNLHEEMKPPADATALKMSEYWELKEKAGAPS